MSQTTEFDTQDMDYEPSESQAASEAPSEEREKKEKDPAPSADSQETDESDTEDDEEDVEELNPETYPIIVKAALAPVADKPKWQKRIDHVIGVAERTSLILKEIKAMRDAWAHLDYPADDNLLHRLYQDMFGVLCTFDQIGEELCFDTLEIIEKVVEGKRIATAKKRRRV